MSETSHSDKPGPDIGGGKLGRALGRAMAETAAQLEEPGAEQLDLLEAREVVPAWAPAHRVDELEGRVEAGRRRAGRPKGARNRVGQAFWEYVAARGLPDPALEALKLIQLGPTGMAAAMQVEHEKAAELYVRLVSSMLDKRLPSMAALQVSGDRGGGVNVAFNFGAPEGGFPAAGDGSLTLEGTVGNQALSGEAPAELEGEKLEGGASD